MPRTVLEAKNKVIITVPFPNASHSRLLFSSPYKNPCKTGLLIPISQMVKLEVWEGKWPAQADRAGAEKGQDLQGLFQPPSSSTRWGDSSQKPVLSTSVSSMISFHFPAARACAIASVPWLSLPGFRMQRNLPGPLNTPALRHLKETSSSIPVEPPQ